MSTEVSVVERPHYRRTLGKQFIVRLPDELLDAVERIAREDYSERAVVVRAAVVAYVRGRAEKEKGLA